MLAYAVSLPSLPGLQRKTEQSRGDQRRRQQLQKVGGHGDAEHAEGRVHHPAQRDAGDGPHQLLHGLGGAPVAPPPSGLSPALLHLQAHHGGVCRRRAGGRRREGRAHHRRLFRHRRGMLVWPVFLYSHVSWSRMPFI